MALVPSNFLPATGGGIMIDNTYIKVKFTKGDGVTNESAPIILEGVLPSDIILAGGTYNLWGGVY